ncbi:MAG: hypothetical protein AAB152_04100 [Candidatus Coatesbacteria bacterium]
MDGDQLEVKVGRYVADILRGNTLIEIQTGSFANARTKLRALTADHRIRLVYPVAKRKWIVKVSKRGKVLSRKPSPRKGRAEDVFNELISMPDLIGKRNFSLDVLLIEQEDLRCDDGKGSWWRKGVSTVDTRLVQVLGRIELDQPGDYLQFIPKELANPFTNAELADAAGLPVDLARKTTYCLRKAGLLREGGWQGKARLLER